jgi:hypothetical protein
MLLWLHPNLDLHVQSYTSHSIGKCLNPFLIPFLLHDSAQQAMDSPWIGSAPTPWLSQYMEVSVRTRTRHRGSINGGFNCLLAEPHVLSLTDLYTGPKEYLVLRTRLPWLWLAVAILHRPKQHAPPMHPTDDSDTGPWYHVE